MPDQPFEGQPAPEGGSSSEVEIDLTAFLPENVTIEQPDVDLVAIESETSAASDEGSAEPAPDPFVNGDAQPPTPDEDAIDVELLESVERDLDAVDAALAAIDGGTYGSCAVCSSPIGAEVLSVDPVRRTCAEHA